MRNLEKLQEPNILFENKASWTTTAIENPSEYNKTRYRHPEIKEKLKEETYNKCIYCESKIGHNTPGDIEHIKPVSLNESLRFEWNNLTIACTECNRRKNDYFDSDKPFLNPYLDNVEDSLIHLGPLVLSKPGDDNAEISIKILQLNCLDSRKQLIARKIDKINEVQNLLQRIRNTSNQELKSILLFELKSFTDNDSEYSAMIKSFYDNHISSI